MYLPVEPGRKIEDALYIMSCRTNWLRLARKECFAEMLPCSVFLPLAGKYPSPGNTTISGRVKRMQEDDHTLTNRKSISLVVAKIGRLSWRERKPKVVVLGFAHQFAVGGQWDVQRGVQSLHGVGHSAHLPDERADQGELAFGREGDLRVDIHCSNDVLHITSQRWNKRHYGIHGITSTMTSAPANSDG